VEASLGHLDCLARSRKGNMPSKVLIVDDDPPTCELICEILRSAGLEANFLTSSAEAAERMVAEKFHAVFLDMRMPPPDGVELARQVRHSRKNASSVIVMITGEEDRTLMKRAFEAGVEFFLFKPVERSKLLKLIRVAEGSIEHERRRFTRVRLRCLVSIESGKDRLEGKTVDLSLGGMLVQSHQVFPPETIVALRLELEAGKAPLLSDARVVRTVGTDCMGIHFENLGAKESRRLQDFLLPLILAALDLRLSFSWIRTLRHADPFESNRLPPRESHETTSRCSRVTRGVIGNLRMCSLKANPGSPVTIVVLRLPEIQPGPIRDCGRVTGKPEVISPPVGLVPTNARLY